MAGSDDLGTYHQTGIRGAQVTTGGNRIGLRMRDTPSPRRAAATDWLTRRAFDRVTANRQANEYVKPFALRLFSLSWKSIQMYTAC